MKDWRGVIKDGWVNGSCFKKCWSFATNGTSSFSPHPHSESVSNHLFLLSGTI